MIAETLRNRLFEHPAPPEHRGAAFAALSGFMFPVRAEFLRLLESRDSEVQIDAAKKILLALAYNSAIFPPNKFIRNLLDFESKVMGEGGGASYVARDHFVHLVHLYLIGLYVFWYHGGFHASICDQVRKIIPKGERDKPSVMRAALTAWRSFVLFHDLGYPWEATRQVEDAKPYLEPFTQVHQYAAKDHALYVLSQLVALEWIMSEEHTLLGEVIDDLPEPRNGKQREFSLPPPNWENERELLNDARKVPSFSDRTLIRLLEKIVGEDRLVPVLESISDEQPCASTWLTFDQFLRTRGSRLRNKAPSASQVEDWAIDFEVPAEHAHLYKLVFYAREFDAAFDKFVGSIFAFDDARLEKPDIEFRVFARQFLAESPPERPEGPAPRFNEYAFAIYQQLLETLDFDTLDRTVHHSIQLGWALSAREYSGLQGVVLKEVTQAIGKKLSQKAKDLGATNDADIAKIGLPKYLERLLQDLKNDDLPEVLEKGLSEGLKDRVKRKSNLYRFYRSIREPIFKQLGTALPCFINVANPATIQGDAVGDSGASTKGGILLDEPNLAPLAQDNCGRIVETLLTERKLGGLGILQQYHPRYAPSTGYTDHGIAAGALLGVVSAGLRRLQTIEGPLRSLLAVRGRFVSAIGDRPEDSDQFVAELIYTILIHNLYPAEFSDKTQKEFRTGRFNSSFAFFSLFCDNLQHWDRRALINQARGPLPYGVKAEHFDIEIVKSRFQITERGPRVETSERDQKLRAQLNDFLEGGAQLIDLSLTEWYPQSPRAK